MIGPHASEWANALTQVRGVEAVRVLLGLKALTKKHSSEALDAVCKAALAHGSFRLRTIRQLLKRGSADEQKHLGFLEHHPVIRPLSDYSLQSLHEFRKERSHECNTS